MSAQQCRVVGVPVAYGLETFKNRTAELEHIGTALNRPDTRVVTIVGRRGIGKSALAAKAAERLAGGTDGFRPQGIVNISSRTSGISLERVFLDSARLLDQTRERELGQVWASGRSVADKVIELFTALAPLRCLALVDNLEDQLTDEGEFTDADLGLLFDLVFRAATPPRLLVTTQVPPVFPPEVRRYEARLRLDTGLPVAEGIELLRDLDRGGEALLRETTDEELARVVRRVHAIPRGLELLVAALSDDYLTMPSLDEVLATFAARGDIVAGLSQDRYRRLDGHARLVMDVLAVFRRPVTVDAVAWVLGPVAPAVDAAPALAALARTHMATPDRRTRTFALHPLDADLAYAALPEAGVTSRRALERRVAQWYLHDAPSDQEWHTADDVLPHRRAFDHLVRAEDFEPAARVLEEIGDFLVWQGSSAAVLDMHQEIDGHLLDEDALIGHLVGFGFARTIGGPLTEAIAPLERALELVSAQGDERKLEHALRILAAAYRPAGRLGDAVSAAGRAADLARRLGMPQHESHSLLNLSLAHSYLGQVGDALRAAGRMVALGEELGDDLVLARAHDARSAAYLVARQWREASDAAAAALEAYRRSGVPEAVGYTHNTRGVALLGLGQTAAAESAFLLGVKDSDIAGQPRAEGLCRYNLAWAHWVSGRYRQAGEQAVLSRQAFERAACPEFAAATLLAGAAAAMDTGDRVGAASRLRQAAAYARTNSDLCPGEWLTAAAAGIAVEEGSSMEPSGQADPA